MIPLYNPATGDILAEIKSGTREDFSAALDKSEEAFERWRSVNPVRRGKILYKTAELVRESQDELAALLTREQGKILPEAKNEVMGFANVFEYYASVCGRCSTGEASPKTDYGYAYTRKEPIGVCGAIIPWNMPVLIAAWKSAPAIASGCTIILKPSVNAPLTVTELAETARRAGLPDGVFEIVSGTGETVGTAMAESRKLAALSFTGSVQTGREVEMKSCGTHKRLTMELGGSDPMVVLSDADLKSAVSGAVSGRFFNCGQTCTAVKRLFVEENIADEFTKLLIERVKSMKVGDGLVPKMNMGPLNSSEGLVKIENLIGDVKDNNWGNIIEGGNRLPAGENRSASGYFFAPTIIENPELNSPLMTEEVFGPVLPIVRISGIDEGIELADSTRFGLGASVWTQNLKSAYRFAEEIHSGIVWVNRHLKIPPEVPFGGENESGYNRENGPGAFNNYLKEKTVIISP